MLTIVVLVFWLASGSKLDGQFWFWIAVSVIVDGWLLNSLDNDKKRKKGPQKVSAMDKYLFDKGATYRNGHEYELYVAYFLERKGYRNVEVTQKSGDYGADILCRDRNGKRVAVQCKLYQRPVGYRAVEEVLAAMHYYRCDSAMVVTNSTYTQQAINAANKVGVKLLDRVR